MDKVTFKKMDPKKAQWSYEIVNSVRKKAAELYKEGEGKGYSKEDPAGIAGAVAKVIKSFGIPKMKKSTEIEDAFSFAYDRIFKNGKYRTDYLRYKRLHKKFTQDLADERISAIILDYEPYLKHLKQKLNLLERLMKLANQLYDKFSSNLEAQYRSLEVELLVLLSVNDRSCLLAGNDASQSGDVFKLFLRTLRYLIIRIARILFRSHRRDVRTKLREIVRHHFKNMDDESDANGILNPNVKNFITQNLLSIWTRKNQLNSLKIY